MEMLQVREKEIFDTLKKIKGKKFVIIGGYAVNAYTFPRFSVDCDIVVKDEIELGEIEKKLIQSGYEKKPLDNLDMPYHGKFERYEKEITNGLKVSMDILVKEILDRQTKVSFSAAWVFQNSKIRVLKGKTIQEKIKLRIINTDALFVMKMISCRPTDIRDCFMLATTIKNKEWIRQEVSERYDFNDRFSKIKDKIFSKQFRDGLQGIFGFIDARIFDKHKTCILQLKGD